MNKISSIAAGILLACGMTACDSADSPKVVITSVSGDQNMQVQGRTSGKFDLQSLAINGTSSSISGNNFSNNVADARFYRIEATDKKKNKTIFDVADAAEVFPASISVRINSSGMAILATELRSQIKALPFHEYAVEADPIIVSVPLTTDFELFIPSEDDVSIGTTAVIVTPLDASSGTARASIRADMYDINVLFEDRNSSANPKRQYIVTIGHARMTGYVTMTGDGVLQSRINITEVNFFESFDVESKNGGAAGEAAAGLASYFDGTVADSLKEALADTIDDDVNTTLAGIAYTFDGLDVNGGIVDVAASPNALASDTNGLSFTLNSHIQAATPLPSGIPQTLGSFYIDSSVPVLDGQTESGKTVDGITVMSSNILNQALLAAYQSGATEITEYYDGKTFASVEQATGQDVIADSDVVRLTVSPQTTAYMRIGNRADAIAEITLDNVIIRLDRKAVGDGAFSPIFSALVDAQVALSISAEVNEDMLNHLKATVKGQPEINVVSFTDESGSVNTAYVNALVKNVMPFVLGSSARQVGSIPLPALGGYQLNVQEVWSVGEFGEHLAIGVNFESIL